MAYGVTVEPIRNAKGWDADDIRSTIAQRWEDGDEIAEIAADIREAEEFVSTTIQVYQHQMGIVGFRVVG